MPVRALNSTPRRWPIGSARRPWLLRPLVDALGREVMSADRLRERRPILHSRHLTVTRKAGKVQQHCEVCRAFDERADRRTAKTQHEISFPMPRHRPIGCLRRALADHDLRRDKTLAALPDACPRHPHHPVRSQTGRQLAAQCSSALNVQCLIDGFVADAHCLVMREVDRQATRNLLRTPCPGPSPVLSPTMPAPLSGHRRTGNGKAARAVVARYSSPPLRVAALRRTSREIVEADRPSRRPISCREWPCTRRRAISSRSISDRYRPESGFAEDRNIVGGMPPAFGTI
jgi:hypothetical protein